MDDTAVICEELHALAMDFEGEALHESHSVPYNNLRRCAAQIRFCAVLVQEGTYSYSTGLAWLDAGRLTLKKARRAYAV
jgi:hypothetical protein